MGTIGHCDLAVSVSVVFEAKRQTLMRFQVLYNDMAEAAANFRYCFFPSRLNRWQPDTTPAVSSFMWGPQSPPFMAKRRSVCLAVCGSVLGSVPLSVGVSMKSVKLVIPLRFIS